MSIDKLAKNSPGEKILLLGNEAIARGVIESGVQVAAAYPGTPSSEIVDSLARVAKQTEQYVEWSTNEKVAFECAAGAAFLGVRSFSAMKSVGLNVAMDPLMVVNLCGVEGGFVFVVADDPNCWSTQNEQDSRLLAWAAEIPCLEPSSVQEAKDMICYAYKISEELNRAIMIRTVTRLNHSRAPVILGPIANIHRNPKFCKQRAGFPALLKHKTLHEEQGRIQKLFLDCPFNEISIKPNATIGIIAVGNVLSYTHEAISSLNLDDQVNLLKLGVINPLPTDLIVKFLSSCSTVIILEEIEPFVEGQIRSLCYGKSSQPRILGKLSGDLEIPGEMTREKIIEVLSRIVNSASQLLSFTSVLKSNELVLNRDTVLCAGCPHMGTFYAIRKAARNKKMRVLISGDIGCYGLGLFPPYNLFDSHICMGASIGIGNGYAATGYKNPIICVIGDSTFYHSGISGLVNAVFNKHNITVVILDNSIIGMTGHQPDPGTGRTATGETTIKIEMERLVSACGVEYVAPVNPFQVDATVEAIKAAMAFQGPSVVIAKGECAIISKRESKSKKITPIINDQECDACGLCANLLYCPALAKGGNSYVINNNLCTGCGICTQICPKSAIHKEGLSNGRKRN